MTGLMQDIEEGLRDLETQDADPLRIAEDALPLYVEIRQLQQLGEVQVRAYQLLASTFEKAGEESKTLSPDLCAELLTQRRRSIKDAALERARMAVLTREFYQPAAVRRPPAGRHR